MVAAPWSLLLTHLSLMKLQTPVRADQGPLNHTWKHSASPVFLGFRPVTVSLPLVSQVDVRPAELLSKVLLLSRGPGAGLGTPRAFGLCC